MGSIITRINDRIDEFGLLEAYLAFLEEKGRDTQVKPGDTNVHDMDVVNIPIKTEVDKI